MMIDDINLFEKAEKALKNHVNEIGHSCCQNSIFVLIKAKQARAEAFYPYIVIIGEDEEFVGVCSECREQVPEWPAMNKMILIGEFEMLNRRSDASRWTYFNSRDGKPWAFLVKRSKT